MANMFGKFKVLITILLLMTTVRTEDIKVVCVTFCILYADGIRLGTYMYNENNAVPPRIFTITDDIVVLGVMVMALPPKFRAFAIESIPEKKFETGTKSWKCMPRVDVDGEWTVWKFDGGGWKNAVVANMQQKCKDSNSEIPCLEEMDTTTAWITVSNNVTGLNKTKAILCRLDISGRSYVHAMKPGKADESSFWTRLKITILVVEIVAIVTCVIFYGIYKWKKAKQ